MLKSTHILCLMGSASPPHGVLTPTGKGILPITQVPPHSPRIDRCVLPLPHCHPQVRLTPGQAQLALAPVLLAQLGEVGAAVHEGLHARLPLGDEASSALAGEPHRVVTHTVLAALPQLLALVLTNCGAQTPHQPQPGRHQTGELPQPALPSCLWILKRPDGGPLRVAGGARAVDSHLCPSSSP